MSGELALLGTANENKRRLLEQLLRERAERRKHYPLSLIQEPLWFMERMLPGRPIYHIHSGFTIDGPLRVFALERVLDEIQRRHESLRTVFPEIDGQPVQVVQPHTPFSLPITDLSGLDEIARQTEIERLLRAQAHAPIDLETGPVWQAALFRVEEQKHLLFLKMHHIVSDGWSLGVLGREMAALYDAFSQGKPSPLPPIEVHYRDYAQWQRQRMQGEQLEAHLRYWREQLAGIPSSIDLPARGPRPAVQRHRGGHRQALIATELVESARTLGRSEKATLYVVLLAVFQIVLARYTRQTDITLGSPMANRVRSEFEPLIGYFSNMLVLRSDLSGDPSFRELLRRVRRTATEAYAHQELPFEALVQALRPERDPSRHPLFQVMFVLQAGRGDLRRSVQGLTFQPLKSGTGSSKFDLQLSISKKSAGYRAALGYDLDLFEAAVIERLLDHFQVSLAAVVDNPDLPLSRVPLLDARERTRLLDLGRGTVRLDAQPLCPQALFEAQVQNTPAAPALEAHGASFSYAQLNANANRLARRLCELGVNADQPVVIHMNRCVEFVVAILAVLKAGGAYLPLDLQIPPERVRGIIAQSGARVLLTVGDSKTPRGNDPAWTVVDVSQVDILPADESNLEPRATPAHLAYVIYTSGSSGQPKGVMVERRALGNYIQAVDAEYGIAAGDRVLQFASISFDAHVEEIFPALCRGATVVLRSDEMLDSYATFLHACDRAGITVLSLPTSYWHELVGAMETDGLKVPARLRLMIIGGERALAERAAAWIGRVGGGVRLLNTYGPSEATVIATCEQVLDPALEDGRLMPVPIGRPIGNVRAWVLDPGLEPTPLGVAGDLYLGGDCLARGYLGAPALTAECFIADPFTPDGRLYRTGDLARWRADGKLEYIGRDDGQVKLRGYRVEPQEIEAILNQHPDVAQAAVVVDEAPVSAQLVACVVARTPAPPGAATLRAFASERLPRYMVPGVYLFLETLPTTLSGKIDRKALHVTVSAARATWTQPDYEAPVTDSERRLALIFAELLKLPQVGRTDNFFDLGGHSLLAVRAMARVRAEFSVDVPLVMLFAKPTVAELASVIDEHPMSGSAAGLQDSQAILARLFAVSSGSLLVPMGDVDNDQPTLFMVHGLGGHLAIYAEFTAALAGRLRIYGLQAAGLDGKQPPQRSVQEMAGQYVAALRGVQKHGPYRLGGWSMGGIIALEMAQQLAASGETVDWVAMLDTHLMAPGARQAVVSDSAVLKWIATRLGMPMETLQALPREQRWRAVLEHGRAALALPEHIGEQELEAVAEVCKAHIGAIAVYEPLPYPGRVMLFRAEAGGRRGAARAIRHENHDGPARWRALFPALVERSTPGSHYGIMRQPGVSDIARQLIEIMSPPGGEP